MTEETRNDMEWQIEEHGRQENRTEWKQESFWKVLLGLKMI